MKLLRSPFKIFLVITLFSFQLTANSQQISDSGKKFETLLKIIDRTYVDSVNEAKLTEHAIREMLKELDPHSVYISQEDLKRMNEPLLGNFEGVGIQFNILRDTITVVSAISGGPSEALGIRSGDKIVKIEDELVAGVGIKNDGVIERLRGQKGTEVNVSIQRNGIKDLLDYTITRDKIPIYSVDASYMASPDIGYIKINRFSATTMNEFEEGMKILKEKGMQHMILDLRDNSGGYLQTAIDLADEFLTSNKMVVYTEGRSFPRDEKIATSKGSFEKGKLVVLINEGSASASEIVSGAIQDWDRGLVIGRRSFGKGLVQKPYRLPDGSAVRLTVSRYYTPTGRSIQKPYDDGVESYYKEILNRYEHGEFIHKDSISMPDSLKYHTPNGRVVYGGGGIMPDIFVPLDTTRNSDFYTDIRRKGLLNEFALSYIERNIDGIAENYASVDQFIAKFDNNGSLLEEFIKYAEKKGIERDQENMEKSTEVIHAQLKALIARGVWKTSGYYQVMNGINNTYLKAIEVIQDNTFEKMHLAYK